MADAMKHRGPDDEGYVLINSYTGDAEVCRGPDTHEGLTGRFINAGRSALSCDVGFAHRRLSILDVSPAGHQPMCDPSGKCWTVLNGEIYNFIELRTELKAFGHSFHSASDTEVLLAAYMQWGKNCLQRLNGMFAFAVWDGRSRTLFAARDRCGEKPFHFISTGELFAFASEMKALFAAGLWQPEANLRVLARYLVLGEIDCEDITVFGGVMRLPPAHCLIYENGTARVERYWDIEGGAYRLRGISRHAGVQARDDARYAAQFSELFTNAVSIRLRSDVPVGSCLSGGIDSSSVVTTACHLLDSEGRQRSNDSRSADGGSATRPLPERAGFSCFSACFPGAKVDESRYMEEMARHVGADWHRTFPTAAEFAADLERVIAHQEEPFISTSIYAQWKVMELAKQSSVTVLLDGQGADEALAGYQGYFCDYYNSLFRELRFGEAAGAIAAYYRARERLVPYFARSFLPYRAEAMYRRFLAAGCVADALMALAPAGTEQPLRADLDFFTSRLYLTLAFTSVPQLVRYSDRNSMAFGREVRLPFLDYRLLEFLFAIPRHQIMRGPTTKVVLRNAMAGIVPDSVRLRKDKIGFETPEESWFRGDLAAWISDVFASSSFKERGWWEPRRVQQKWLRFSRGKGGRFRDLIWRIVCAETWANVFRI